MFIPRVCMCCLFTEAISSKQPKYYIQEPPGWVGEVMGLVFPCSVLLPV